MTHQIEYEVTISIQGDTATPTLAELFAWSVSTTQITVSWDSPHERCHNYVVFEYVKDLHETIGTFDPMRSPSSLFGIGRKVEPRPYTLKQFFDLISTSESVKFTYVSSINVDVPVNRLEGVEILNVNTRIFPNYSNIISFLEKRRLVKTIETKCIMAEDKRKFAFIRSSTPSRENEVTDDTEVVYYEVDCLGTKLGQHLSKEVLTLYYDTLYATTVSSTLKSEPIKVLVQPKPKVNATASSTK